MADPDRPLAHQEEEPPHYAVETAIEQSTFSPCRSKRGVVVFSDGRIDGHGYNFKPRGFDCDGSDACKATCRREAVHAEQMALLSAGNRAHASEMLHVKTVGGKLVASGGPSCVECSKLARAAGVAWFWLYEQDGWHRYEMADFHRRSLVASEAPTAPVQEEAWETTTADGHSISVTLRSLDNSPLIVTAVVDNKGNTYTHMRASVRPPAPSEAEQTHQGKTGRIASEAVSMLLSLGYEFHSHSGWIQKSPAEAEQTPPPEKSPRERAVEALTVLTHETGTGSVRLTGVVLTDIRVDLEQRLADAIADAEEAAAKSWRLRAERAEAKVKELETT